MNISIARKFRAKRQSEKYGIPDDAKKWVFEAVGSSWRKYKNQLKATHFTAYKNDELRMENRQVDILQFHFKDLLKYWNSDPHKKISKTNTHNQNKLKCPHAASRTPFALIREWKKEKEISHTSDTISSKDIFVATRTRKFGRVYKSSYDITISKIAEMERLHSTQENEDVSHLDDAFTSIMVPEHPGRMRLCGRGVIQTVLKGHKGNLGSSDERKQHKMEEMEERMQQRMHEKLNEKRMLWNKILQ